VKPRTKAQGFNEGKATDEHGSKDFNPALGGGVSSVRGEKTKRERKGAAEKGTQKVRNGHSQGQALSDLQKKKRHTTNKKKAGNGGGGRRQAR